MNHLRRHPQINWSIVGDDVVALDPRPDDARVHVLRGASAIVWQQLDGTGLEELIERLRVAFGLDRDEATRDVTAAVTMLAGADLLDRSNLTHQPTE